MATYAWFHGGGSLYDMVFNVDLLIIFNRISPYEIDFIKCYIICVCSGHVSPVGKIMNG